jgi:hypothetical protein
VRILCVVAVEVGDSLLLIFSGKPIFNKLLDLRNVHELNVIYMPVFLPFYHHVRRYTLVTHGFRVGFVALAGSIDFVANLGGREAIVAFDFCRMYSLALKLLLFQPVIERNVSSISNKLLV